jgi:hypothetical protein
MDHLLQHLEHILIEIKKCIKEEGEKSKPHGKEK